MADTKIAKLQAQNGDTLLPRTRSTLVECADGRSVETALADKQPTMKEVSETEIDTIMES